MPHVRVTTPSRLHFGLLAWDPAGSRQFGGVGLMIDRPGIDLTAGPAGSWTAEGPLAERALRIAERVAGLLPERGYALGPCRLQIHRAPPEHVGLGTGTQLSLAVVRALMHLAGRSDVKLGELVQLAGRGLRSGIGLHGFEQGGLIVDGGHRSLESGAIPPLLARMDFPRDWHILVILPPGSSGLHGTQERHAFESLPAIPDALTDRLCRLTLLGLLPAVAERDLVSFGAALHELQCLVGRRFAPLQGGRAFASPVSAPLIEAMHRAGLHGAGQSSWGPTLYAFSDEPPARRVELLEKLRERIGLNPNAAFWATPANRGATVLQTDP